MSEPSKRGNVQDAWARWRFTVLKLAELFDVDLATTAPVSGNGLVFDGTKWVPGAESASLIENVNTVSASGSTQTLPDVTVATMHDITLTANCTFTFPTAAGGKSFSMRLAQDGTGSRTVTWPGTVKWAGGTAPTLSTTASAVDALAFVCIDGAHWYGFFAAKGLS